MKTILAPTDFSKIADNALDYAAELGKISGATVILFHALQVPVMPAEGIYITPPFDELEKMCLKDLRKIERRLRLRHGKDLAIQCVCKCGFTVEEINNYASEHKVDLIVVGTQGAGYLTEKLFGSITTSLIRHSKRPLLTIDKNVKYHPVKKIAFACDYIETENKKILEPLKEFAKLFKSHVCVLNVAAEQEPEPAGSRSTVVSDFMKLEYSLAGINHTFHYVRNEEVVDGINEFVKESKADMVVMVPRKHNLFGNIFNEPKSRKMAFHAVVPFLALH